MIYHCEDRHIPGLKALWAEVFGDKKEFIDSFFEHVFHREETLCFEEQGMVRAMLYRIPCVIKRGNESRKGYYFYALATEKRFRGRGIMGKMLAHAMEEIRREEGAIAFLIPAEDELKKYYEKFGFYPLKNTMAQDMRLLGRNEGCKGGDGIGETGWKVRFADRVQDFLQKQREGLKKSACPEKEADGLEKPDFAEKIVEESQSHLLSVCATEPIDMLQGLIPM